MMPAIDQLSVAAYGAAVEEAAQGTGRPQNLVSVGLGVLRMLEDDELTQLSPDSYRVLLRAEAH